MRSQMCIRIRERAGGEVFACDYKKRREVAPFLGILDGREKGAEDPHLLPSAFKSGHTRNMHAHSFAGAATFESHTDAQIMTIKCGAASGAQLVK